MPDDRESPSGGWHEVYDAMAADAGVEEPTHPCPDCRRSCRNLVGDAYECEEHGVFRASADGGETPDGESDASGNDAPETDDAPDRTRWPAD